MSEIKIAFVGDTMCGDTFYSLGSGVGSNIKKYGVDFLDSRIQKIFKAHDIVMGNVECVLSDKGKNRFSLRKMAMRGAPVAAQYLKSWGLTVANLANNHILEQGLDAACDTAANLRKAGIAVIGSGEGDRFADGISPAILSVGKQKIAFIGISLRKEQYAYNGGGSLADTLNAVKELSRKGLPVVVSVHWGNEYIDKPSVEQRDIAKQLKAAGAQIIVGHHSHVPHGVVHDKKSLVAYSMGNFIFNGFYKDTEWSFILGVTLKNKQITGVKYYPITKIAGHRTILVDAKKKKNFEKEIERRNDLVSKNAHWDEMDVYNKAVLKIEHQFRKELKIEIRKNIFSMPLYYWPQLFLRPIQRRLGFW